MSDTGDAGIGMNRFYDELTGFQSSMYMYKQGRTITSEK